MLDTAALLDDRAGRDGHHGHRAHEDLQQQERVVRRHAGQRTEAVQVSQIAMPDSTATSIGGLALPGSAPRPTRAEACTGT